MKKILALILSLIMVCTAFAACDGGSTADSSDTTTAIEAQKETETENTPTEIQLTTDNIGEYLIVDGGAKNVKLDRLGKYSDYYLGDYEINTYPLANCEFKNLKLKLKVTVGYGWRFDYTDTSIAEEYDKEWASYQYNIDLNLPYTGEYTKSIPMGGSESSQNYMCEIIEASGTVIIK